jgi:hypothetical protein
MTRALNSFFVAMIAIAVAMLPHPAAAAIILG